LLPTVQRPSLLPRNLSEGKEMPFGQACNSEAEGFSMLSKTCNHGRMKAFIEKRKPECKKE